jgi:phage replication-related protein YjqB (UPF0714/DUF867 family)
MSAFRELLAHPEVEEVCVLRGHDREHRLGFMAYHGGGLEEMTEVIAQAAAERAGVSYYGVHQPTGMERHIPSIEVSPDHSDRLRSFFDHVHCVITIHGFGRWGYFSSLLVGGRHRALAEHVGQHLRDHLPAYDIVTDIERIPKDLRGMHPRNPVNLPPQAGVQIELPPRVRGSSPLWWDWEGPGLTPHTESLVSALALAATTWTVTAPDE